jgi:hypothetical protein
MRQAGLVTLIVASIVIASAATSIAAAASAPSAAAPSTAVATSAGTRYMPGTVVTLVQQEGPGRGDDLARIQQWRAFLDPADRAFTAAHMSTTAVKAKITEADGRIEELKDDPKNEQAGRSDITGDVGFLERALRAFTAASMSTTDVKRWLEEAKEATSGK